MRVGEKVTHCLFANRPCDRIIGKQSSTVFIAAPSEDQYHFETAAAERIVRAGDLSPIVAVHTNLLSEDIFCEKICTYIIESRFCIAFLNGGNPNVLYEYGLMRPFRKRVISLQRRGEKPPFNVQHLDTLRYPRKDLEQMLTDAVEAAVAATKSQPLRAKPSVKRPSSPFAARVLKLLELQGISIGAGDAVKESVDGTPFTVLRGRSGVHFVAILEAQWSSGDALAETMIVCRRLGRQYHTLKKALAVREKKGWRGGDQEHRARIADIEHLTFVYATPETPPSATRDDMLRTIAGWSLGFPLPDILLWSSGDVDRELASVVATGGSEA